MSTPALPLRCVDAARLAQEAAFRRCQALGWRVAWAPLPRQGSVLRFRQSGAQGEAVSLVSTTAWVARHWPGLDGLAWDALDEASARDLFDLPDGGPLDAAWLGDGDAHAGAPWPSQWLQQISAPSTAEWPCVDTDIGPVWIESLHIPCEPAAPAEFPHAPCLSIEYRLAQHAMRIAQLRTLGEGDVLLLDSLAPTALLEGQALFSFALHEDHIMVIDFDARPESDELAQVARQDPNATPHHAEPRLELEKLSVTVDVVLCRMAQSLAALSELHPGSTIALEEGVHRGVELRVQGQLLATGELVAVGDGLGVQILSRVDRK